MNKLLIGAVALSVAVPGIAQGQVAPAAPPPPPPQRMDQTQTRDQAVAKVQEHFATMDKNRDGFVAGDELMAMRTRHQGMSHRMGERRERRAERMAMANPGAAFDRLDVNRDNMISRDEFAKGRELRIERRVVINGAPGKAGDPHHGAGGHHGMGTEHRMGARMGGGRLMRLADLDKDGRVSLQEATTSAMQRFDRVDANRDGRITPDERRQQREQRRAMRGNRAG